VLCAAADDGASLPCAVEVAGHRERGEVHADGKAQKLCGIPRLLSARTHSMGMSDTRLFLCATSNVI